MFHCRYLKCGLIAGPFFVILFAIFNLILLFYEWYIPREQIDIAPDYPSERSEKSATQEQSSDPTSRE